MYIIFQNGGKQYKVKKNQIIRLEKINAKVGEIIECNSIIFLSNKEGIFIGNPFIKNYKIKYEILLHGREKKITIIKFHRRKRFRRKQGHRQNFTEVKILNISNSL